MAIYYYILLGYVMLGSTNIAILCILTIIYTFCLLIRIKVRKFYTMVYWDQKLVLNTKLSIM
jgi:hypothetical protein